MKDEEENKVLAGRRTNPCQSSEFLSTGEGCARLWKAEGERTSGWPLEILNCSPEKFWIICEKTEGCVTRLTDPTAEAVRFVTVVEH